MQHQVQNSKCPASKTRYRQTIGNEVETPASYGYMNVVQDVNMTLLPSDLLDSAIDPFWFETEGPALPHLAMPTETIGACGFVLGTPNAVPPVEDEGSFSSPGAVSSMIAGVSSPVCDIKAPKGDIDRKVRNRTAQRNFRQRQVQLVQDMEDGIGLLQDKRSLLHANNELLRTQLENLRIENEVLQAAVARPPSVFVFPHPIALSSPESDASTVDTVQSSRRASVPFSASRTARSGKGSTSRQPIPRRAHKKSKTGCRTCKLRKVKCDETRPLCDNCSRHFTDLKTCDFDELDHTFVESESAKPSDEHGSQQSPNKLLSIEQAWQLLQSDPRYLLDKVDIDRFAKGLRERLRSDGKAISFDRDQVVDLIQKISAD